MKQMIVAIDFSDVSSAVVAEAVSIAKSFSARLVLLHVAAPDPDFVGFDVGPQSVRNSRAAELRKEHREIQQIATNLRSQGVDAEAFLAQGATVDTILERADQVKAELIVLGSHGHSAVFRALLGSVSEGVLRKATCPVLIVPAFPGALK